MILPYDLLTKAYTKPKVFLCETDKTRICELNTMNLNGTFKFNSYSEIEFEVSRNLFDTLGFESESNQVYEGIYDKIEALRFLYIPGFGYFQIQNPVITSDGVRETKSINAFSSEYTLSQRYLVNFIINNPDINGNIGGGDPLVIDQITEEVTEKFANEQYYANSLDGGKSYKVEYENALQEALDEMYESDPLVQFYNPDNESHSLLHLALQKAYGWSIGHVDEVLATQTRSFDISRESIYDFLMNDVSNTFECYFVFDTINNTVNAYAESMSVKLNGDGSTTSFALNTEPIFTTLGDVTIDGYRTTRYAYDANKGIITFFEAPEVGSIIKIDDGSQLEWQTNVFVSFENLASEMEIGYEADNIKTCLMIKGHEDLDISDVNLGSNYIMDLSYFNTPEWMGNELYEAYNKYIKLINEKTPIYTEYLEGYNDLWEDYSELLNRTTTDKTGLHINLTKSKLDYFQQMLIKYYVEGTVEGNFYQTDLIAYPDNVCLDCEHQGDFSEKCPECGSQNIRSFRYLDVRERLTEDFKFLGDKMTEYLDAMEVAEDIETAEAETLKILSYIWDEFGTYLLQIYVDTYTNNQQTHVESGWSSIKNSNYFMYWANYIMLSSCQAALNKRQKEVDDVLFKINDISLKMSWLAKETSMENNFTHDELVRLNIFIREDEYVDDNFVITDEDSIEEIFKAKKELFQCGKIELSKLSEPTLSFSAKLANIYALEEFKPIVNQFQLGNLINVSLRKGYIKKVRLLEVSINFEDFSDFDCTFGDLISIKSPADIHADLLQQAVSAGKSVASSSSHWNKGSDLAQAIDARIQNGLLDAATQIKATDGTQGVEIDKYGIHLKKIDPETGVVDDKQGWIINNMFCYTDDNWKTTKSVLGEYRVNGQQYWGVLAEAVIAGYIEGTQINGGEINIGNGNFVVDANGDIKMNGANIINGYITEETTKAEINKAVDSIVLDISDIVDRQVTSKIDISAEEILTEVTDLNNDLTSRIQQNADNILLEVSRAKTVEDSLSQRVSDNSSSIKINADSIETKVAKDSVISTINQSAEKITINADKISLKGKTIDLTSDNIVIQSSNFTVNANGTISATNANINGTIKTTNLTATGGTIGGWTIYDSLLRKSLTINGVDYQMYMQAPDGSNTTNAFAVMKKNSNSTEWDVQFAVNHAGKLTAKNATISGRLESVSGTFSTLEAGASKFTETEVKINANGKGFIYIGGPDYTDPANGQVWEDVTIRPGGDKVGNIGTPNHLWDTMYAKTGSISQSDRNSKTDIKNMGDIQEQLFKSLNPVEFKFADSDSGRIHYGFISQDVEDSLNNLGLTGKDFAGFCKDIYLDENGNEVSRYSLRYSEFIALNTFMIQKLQERIDTLEEKLKYNQ